MHNLLVLKLKIAASAAALLFFGGCAQTGQESKQAAALEATNVAACDGEELPTSRLFLQQITDTGAIIKWRGEASTVCLGETADGLNLQAAAVVDGNHKLAQIVGLKPDTTYFYSIGGAKTGGEGQQFRTAPETGKLPADGNIRLWLLGDSGTATEVSRRTGKPAHPGEALAVKAGFEHYVKTTGKNEPADLVLLLGDNAYPAGTDDQWQGAYFNIYPELIKQTATIPTIGNHEMGMAPINVCLFLQIPGCDQGPVMMPNGGISNSSDPMSYDGNGDGPDGAGLPYLDIFSLPTKGEQGGVPSGTEQYYSLNYGTVHVVSLDSQLSTQDPAQMQTMRAWLVDDLSTNELDWTVVIFHHPPYSKGKNHDSDIEQREIDMRKLFNPVFEQHGVDVIYSGHAHSYERSWYLGGHHGLSGSFDARQHAEVDSDGRPMLGQSSDPYSQISAGSGRDDKAVYTVAGNSGKAGGYEKPCKDGVHVGCTMPDWLAHPAHRTFEKLAEDYQSHGIERLGSVVLDVNAKRLVSTFIDDKGEILDYFIIKK